MTEQQQPSSGPGPEEQPRTNGGSGLKENGLSDAKRRELWVYLAVCLTAVELLLAMGALFYGFIPQSGRPAGLHFPWLVWGGLAVGLPALVLLAVHMADVGLFGGPRGGASDDEWQKRLPLRLQRVYAVIKGMPAVVVVLALALLGAALITIDGALTALGRFGAALEPHIPLLAGAAAGLIAAFFGARAWLNYRTRRLHMEYAFRREVLEKTGVIIVDKGSAALPPGGLGEAPRALVAGEENQMRALPDGAVVDVTPVEKNRPETD